MRKELLLIGVYLIIFSNNHIHNTSHFTEPPGKHQYNHQRLSKPIKHLNPQDKTHLNTITAHKPSQSAPIKKLPNRNRIKYNNLKLKMKL